VSKPDSAQPGSVRHGSTGRLDLEEGWRRTSPLGIVTQGLRSLRRAVLPVAAILFSTRSAEFGVGIAVGVGIAIVTLNLLVTTIAWWNTQYRIGSTDVRLHSGILGRQARSVPFERIQDVSLEQGPLARLLRLVEVRFETGAGGKDELKLAYVSQEEGAALRETVRARIDTDPASAQSAVAGGEKAASSAAEETPLFTMGPRRLLVFGLFEFSLVFFAVLAGAAQQLDFLLPFDLWDFDGWEERLAGPGAWLAGAGPSVRVIGAVLAILALAAVGLITGVARTFARDFGFRLDRTSKGFRRRRGLFTRTDVVMPVHRVQAVTVSTGFLRRRWGWHGLGFISLAHDAKSANHTIAPFAQIGELAPIAHAAGYKLPGAEIAWHRPSKRYRLDRAIMSAALPALAALAAAALGFALVAIAALVLAAALAVRHRFLWQHERHALDERQVLSRTGWLAPRLMVASRQKLHSVRIVQGPLAQLRGYANLRFGLAGGSLSLDGLPLSEARHLRAAVLSSIAAVDFSQLPR